MQTGCRWPIVSRQRERDVGISRLAAELSAARGNDDVLLAVHDEGARRGVAGRGKCRLPEQAARRLVECTELRVLCRGNEQEAARGHDGATVLLRSTCRGVSSLERWMLPQCNTPAILDGVEVDRAERTPGWLDRRQARRIAPPLVADELVWRLRAERVLGNVKGIGKRAAEQLANDRSPLGGWKHAERRHEASAVIEHLLYLRRRETGADVHERRRAVASMPIGAMAARAAFGVDSRAIARRPGGGRACGHAPPPGGGQRPAGAHPPDPGDIAAVDVKSACRRIPGRATPFASTVESRQDD